MTINFQRPTAISVTPEGDIIVGTNTQTVVFDALGNGTWPMPFAIDSVTAYCVGGGGGGGADGVDKPNDATDGGGGGGGAAWASRSWNRSDFASGDFSFFVGDGGDPNFSDGRGQDGENSRVTAPNGQGITAGGGKAGARSDEGEGGRPSPSEFGTRGGDGEYAYTESLPAFGGYGGGAAGAGNGGYGGSLGNSYGGPGGDGVNIFGVDQNNGGTATSNNDGKEGGLYGGGGGGGSQGSRGGYGAQGVVGFSYQHIQPFIVSSGISTQRSETGFPDDRLTISWQVENTSHVRLVEVDGGNETIFYEVSNENGVPRIGSYKFNSGLQSTAGTDSPAQMNYRIEAIGPGGKSTVDLTGFVYNDDCPTPFTIPDQVDVEPNETIIIGLGGLTGIDMKTSITASAGLQYDIDFSGGWTSNGFVEPGQSIRVRTTSLPFNTDISDNPTMGKQNIKEVYLDFGESRTAGQDYCYRTTFKVITRAPIVEEIFNFADNKFNIPYPRDPSYTGDEEAKEYMKSPTTVSVDEVELVDPYGVPIRADDTKLQANVTRVGNPPSDNNWKNVDPIP
jgi:hypothetical protein